jgi:bacterial/archaeal transporter family protein
MMEEWIGLAVVLTGAASHGLSYTLGKKAVASVDVVTFSLFRSASGALFLLVFFLLLGYWQSFHTMTPTTVGLALASACLNFWTMLGFFWALRLGRLSLMAPLHMSYPFFVFIFAALFLREEVSLPLLYGSIGILAGITLISMSQDAEKSTAVPAKKVAACLLALSSSLSWGISLVIDKALLAQMPAIPLNLVKIGVPAMGFFLLGRLHGPIPKPKNNDLLRAFGSGMLGLVVANLLYFYALTYSQSVWVAPLSSTSMLFSLLFAIVLLGERPRGVHVLAIILIFSGVLLISGNDLSGQAGQDLAQASSAFSNVGGRNSRIPE